MKSFNNFLCEVETPERQRLNLGVSPGQQSLPGMGKKSGQEKPVKKPQYNPKYYNADGTLKPNAVQTYIQGRAAKDYNRPGVKLTPETKARIDAANATFASAAKGDKKAAQQVAQWTKEFQTKHGLSAPTPAATSSSTPSPRTPAAQQAFRDIKSSQPTSTSASAKSLERLIGSPQRPNVVIPTEVPPAPTKAKVQPKTSKPKVTVSSRTQSWQGPTPAAPKPTPTPAAPKPTPTPTPAAPTATPTATQTGRRLSRGARASVITPRALEAALTKNRQQTALAQQAQNTKAAVQNAKTLKNVAKVGTGIGAYLDFQRASQEVRNQGGGDRRATARGALEAGARIVGSGAGFVAGTPLGPVGQIAGAVGGGEVAVKKTGQAFERIFGKPGDPVTRQSVASNIKSLYREKVPQKIRSQVSPQAKQTFSGFLNKAADFANKAYKGYAKVKNTFDFSPKDN